MKKAIKIARIVLLLAICITFLFPVWLMITNSFTSLRGFLMGKPRLLPYMFTLENYNRAFTNPWLPRWLLNTAFITGSMIVGCIIVSGLAGYVFAFARFRFLKYMFIALLLPIFTCRYTLMISRFVIVGKLGLPPLLAVLSMYFLWSTGIYLFRNYFRSIPSSLIESARLDGANEATIMFRVVFPISKPILGAAIVVLGFGVLSDFVWPLLNMQDIASRTILVGLMLTAIDVYAIKNIGYELAVGTILFVPYLLIFSFASRYFIDGLTGGALKA